jgi:hypothetical protein
VEYQNTVTEVRDFNSVRTITKREDGIPENSFSQNDTIAKSMAKSW